jgi:hypothetical protein
VKVEEKEGFWAPKCGELIFKRARPPYRLISLVRGWLDIERK